jgi:hypothetical protein
MHMRELNDRIRMVGLLDEPVDEQTHVHHP